jgi:hypothetical protein
MKIDPGMHIGLHLVFFGKTGVTNDPEIALPAFTGNLIGQSRRNWTDGPAKTEQQKILKDYWAVLGRL